MHMHILPMWIPTRRTGLGAARSDSVARWSVGPASTNYVPFAFVQEPVFVLKNSDTTHVSRSGGALLT